MTVKRKQRFMTSIIGHKVLVQMPTNQTVQLISVKIEIKILRDLPTQMRIVECQRAEYRLNRWRKGELKRNKKF